MEIWKPVIGYEDTYHVSNLGRVKRLERILKPGLSGNGYPFIALCRNGKSKLSLNHRLVAETFIGPCPKGKEVNHKNGKRTDARLENLEYMTHQENIAHGHKNFPRKHTSLRGTMVPNAVLTEERVKDILRRFKSGESRKDIIASTGIHRSLVYDVCSRKSWKWVSI